MVKPQKMVFRRRTNLSIRPVHRIKHVIDVQGGSAIGVNTLTNLAVAVVTPNTATGTSDVADGSKINGIYLKVEVYATSSGALSNVYMIVLKNPAGNLGVIAPNTVGSDNDKRYVIHQEMVMVQRNINGNPRILFNGVIALPRGYRRFARDDKLQLRILAPGISVDFCIQCHYKEFR